MENNGVVTGYDDPQPPRKRSWLLWGIILGVIIIVLGIGAWFILSPKSDGPKNQPSDMPANQDTTPITISIDNAANSEGVTGTVTITPDINEPTRVARVEYYVDEVFAGVSYATPFSYSLDTTPLPNGEHTIVAKAFDRDGKATNSEAIKITVKHPETPSTSTTTPAQSSNRRTTSSTGTTSSNTGDPGPTPDTSSPSPPGGLVLSANDGYTTTLDWNASTDNVGISSYRIYRDDTLLDTTSATDYKDQTVVPGNTYDYKVQAIDAANNVSADSNEPSITLVPTSIWIDGDSPFSTTSDTDPYEIGVKFRPLVNGKITGVKFYKDATNTGTHVGRLWSSGGSELASATFNSETASGWQTVTFSTPVDVTANTTYIVSYSAPNGHFSFTSAYFATTGITSQYMTAMASGVDGNNGVFSGTIGTFPDQSFNNTNYWVDALFMPNLNAGGPTATPIDNSTVYPGFPGSNNTGVPVGKRLPSRDRGLDAWQANSTIENIKINGEVRIRAGNALIRNSMINGIVYLDLDDPQAGGWHLTMEDSTVNAGTANRAAISLGNYTIKRSNIYGGQTGTLCSGNCEVSDSWLHGQYAPQDQDWHLGGFLSNGGSDMQILRNTISCDYVNNPAGGGCSGDLNLYADFAPIENVTIDGNLLTANPGATYCSAGGYNALSNFGMGTNNVDFINNTVQRGTSGTCGSVPGAVTDYLVGGNLSPGSVWTNNKWDDGTTIDPQ